MLDFGASDAVASGAGRNPTKGIVPKVRIKRVQKTPVSVGVIYLTWSVFDDAHAGLAALLKRKVGRKEIVQLIKILPRAGLARKIVAQVQTILKRLQLRTRRRRLSRFGLADAARDRL